MNTPLQKFKNYCRKTDARFLWRDARLFFVADDDVAILFSAGLGQDNCVVDFLSYNNCLAVWILDFQFPQFKYSIRSVKPV